MRVRIKEMPHGFVRVETKESWFSVWEYVRSFDGGSAWAEAEKFALVLKYPVIKEIE